MIELIIKSYLSVLLPIGIGLLGIFLAGLYIIFNDENKKHSLGSQSGHKQPSLSDSTAIAGENVLTTQLDLARAYIETDKIQLAKTILQSVILQGTAAQQQEAQRLLKRLS